jgi:hypothetical protein
MQSDIDAELTNFFEEAPPRGFATVMRGYDRHQVERRRSPPSPPTRRRRARRGTGPPVSPRPPRCSPSRPHRAPGTSRMARARRFPGSGDPAPVAVPGNGRALMPPGPPWATSRPMRRLPCFPGAVRAATPGGGDD